MSPERQHGPPWVHRFTLQGATKQFQGKRSTVSFSNGEEVKAVEFRGQLFEETSDGLALLRRGIARNEKKKAG